MDFAQPPPNMAMPPPNLSGPPPNLIVPQAQQQGRFEIIEILVICVYLLS